MNAGCAIQKREKPQECLVRRQWRTVADRRRTSSVRYFISERAERNGRRTAKHIRPPFDARHVGALPQSLHDIVD